MIFDPSLGRINHPVIPIKCIGMPPLLSRRGACYFAFA